ncbi:serine hydrolase [Streptomyces sp. NPDC005525]|uniref:serine hydrolase n=1 Tax=Streptomyces sp. NPDC005525 TaxID=3364720 RepID=UPI003684BC1D
MSDTLQKIVLEETKIANVSWSVCLHDAQGHVLAELDAGASLPTASVGKLLLMIEVALQYQMGSIARDDLLSRNPSVAVENSGILQYLRQDSYPVEDLVILVASVSDNYATNILLEHIGLSRIHQLTIELGLKSTSLLDRVRNDRGGRTSPMPFGRIRARADQLHGCHQGRETDLS